VFCSSRAAAWHNLHHQHCTCVEGLHTVWFGSPEAAALHEARSQHFHPVHVGGLVAATPRFGWSNIIVPGKSSQTNTRYCQKLIQVEVFWVVLLCSVMVGCQQLGGSCCLHLQGEVNIDILPPYYEGISRSFQTESIMK
jgi:hypothetical protein